MKPSEHIKNIIEASRTIETGYIDEGYFTRQLVTTDKLFISREKMIDLINHTVSGVQRFRLIEKLKE